MRTAGKLTVGAIVIGGATAYMAYLGAASSWEYYLTVDECVADAAAIAQDRMRVSGTVATDSLRIAADRRQASFILEGQKARLNVLRSGPLPDNLAEGIDVVVQGRLDASGRLRADKILTRCASKYESRVPAAPSRNAPPAVARKRP